MDTNQIILSDCIEYMKHLPMNSIDLVVTSPPYAKQRENTYGGITEKDYADWMYSIGKEIYRVLDSSGSFVLNIKENVIAGERSSYVMETVMNLSEIFHWADTYIWVKSNPFPTGSNKRLKDGFEYCYWFTKTKEYKFFPDNVLEKSKSRFLESEKKRKNKGKHYTSNQSGMNMEKRYISDYVRPSNVITFPSDTTNHEHPATFPIALPSFFIRLMTEENDIVFDPFMGSGTTMVACKKLNRQYLGCDIVEQYVEIAKKRVLDGK